MKITFCLPDISELPMGGYKIVFEYANRLVENKHEVTIVFLTHNIYSRVTKNKLIKSFVGKLRVRVHPKWFQLDSRVKKVATPYLDGREFPTADFVFATAVTTASVIKNLPLNCGRKCYFIQGYEIWIRPEREVLASYKYGFINFTISKWLYDKVERNTNDLTVCLSNPIDTDKFYIIKDIEDRNPYNLCMLYHEGEHKGISFAIAAIKIVKQKFSNIKVNIFGVPDRPEELPDYFKYTQKATEEELSAIYNDSAIFVCASIEEGFGLTGAESMACGCALASTSYLGVFDYAVDGKNSLLSPIKDVEALANNIIRLIEDRELRIRLASEGSENMKERSWDRAVERMENILQNELRSDH